MSGSTATHGRHSTHRRSLPAPQMHTASGRWYRSLQADVPHPRSPPASRLAPPVWQWQREQEVNTSCSLLHFHIHSGTSSAKGRLPRCSQLLKCFFINDKLSSFLPEIPVPLQASEVPMPCRPWSLRKSTQPAHFRLLNALLHDQYRGIFPGSHQKLYT